MTSIPNDPDPLDLSNTSSPAAEQIVDKSQLADHQQEFQHIEGEFEINDDLKLYEQVWLPPGGANGDSIQAKATIVIVHGFGEHSGRYRPLALQLINNGFAVYAYDQRGHGKSGGIRAYIDSWDEYISDFERAIARVYESAGDMPIFILGHIIFSVCPLAKIADMFSVIVKSSPINFNCPDCSRGKKFSPKKEGFSLRFGWMACCQWPA